MAARKRNILITGTPGTGKTSFATLLADATGLQHIDVGNLIKEKKFYDGWDENLECHILDEDLLLDELEDMMREGGKIVDYHSCEFFPKRWFDAVIVLQTNNSILYDRLTSSEIFRVLLEEAKESYKPDIVHALPSNTVEDMSNNVELVQQWLQSRE